MSRWLAWWVAVACAACVARGARELRVLQPDARWSFHVGIAAPPSAAGVVRAFNRTLADVSHTYLAGDYPPHLRRNITLQPLYIQLPEDERFRARVLVTACAALAGRRVAALLVVGAGPAAAAVTLAAARAGVPVLRAAPTPPDFRHSIGTNLLPLEVRLEVTARETLSAIRATLLHTHWHSFTMLAEADINSALSLRKDLLAILTEPPLNPTLLPLPTQYTRHALFRRLADVSRSTRGVIVIICDIHYIQLVMKEAKRLNMLDGHFVWMWIDATQKIDVFHNIANRTQYADDDQETGRAKGSYAWKNYDEFERKKRSGTVKDEPIAGETNLLKRMLETHTQAKEDSGVDIIDNRFLNARAHVVSNSNTKVRSKTHSVNDKIDSLSELYDSRNSSLNDINNNIVKNKGVETSKVERKLNEKVKSFISDKVSYRRNDKIDYLGGDVHNVDVSNSDVDVFELDRGNLLNVVSSNEVMEELYTSDNSDAETNPTVHSLTVNSFRDIPEKRKDRHFSFNKYSEDEFGDAEERERNLTAIFNSLPVGLLALHPLPVKTDRLWVRGAVRLAAGALRRVLGACDAWSAQAQFQRDAAASCWDEPTDAVADFSAEFVRELRVSAAATLAGGTERPDRAVTAAFDMLNLVPDADASDDVTLRWRSVGRVLGRAVRLHTIVWPGGDIVVSGLSARARSVFRVVTARAPPFVMEGELDEDGQCLRGVPCHRLHTNDKDNLTLAFNEMETQERLEEEEEEAQESYFPALGTAGAFHSTRFFEEQKSKYATHCCYGLAMDLLENIAEELEFDFHLYIVNDGLYGARRLTKRYKRVNRDRLTQGDYTPGKNRYRGEYRKGYTEPNAEEDVESNEQDADKWNGIIGDLVSGAAHMSFAALSVSSARAEVVDFSQPYFFSEVSCLAAPTIRSEIPLLAFLLPFSPELWIAIFTSLNVTAIAVAIYEWLSPFGLNPWGRQRSKNFSIASALWVMWGLLCGHLVAFKAPKSWPNKFLINVWGGFSVIFVASYTANIAALIAGLFFHNAVDNYEDRSLLSVRVGAPRASAAEYYVRRDNPLLAQHMRAYSLQDVEEGIIKLRNGSLDLLMADTPILDYYRATDHGCKLQRVGEPFTQDTYAIGMSKGFPLKDSISALISKYSSNGYMDILHEKWYGGLPCFKHATDYGIQPRPLGVAAVAGVFILLGVGVVVGCLILCMEHLFYKYTLPVLRHQPKGTIWRSRNVMFFSQKLYRFINCVELVSPHHAARELVHTLRQGQITSLFQKSVKRKEHEQRRRRRSKAQFFEMIQEIRRVQQEERELPLDPIKEVCNKPDEGDPGTLRTSSSPRNLRPEGRIRSPKLFGGQFRSPRARNKRKSAVGLNVRRFSTDSILGSDSGSIRESYERTSLNIGRRLSRDVDCLSASPPDINSRRSSYLDVGGQRREVSPSPSLLRADHHVSGSATRSFTDVSDGESVAGSSMLAPYSSAAELRARSPVRRAFSQATCPVRVPVEIRVSEVDLPPAPPFPRLAQAGARSELSRLPEDELVRLWRSSERDVRSALLAALQERRAEEPEPG